MFDILRQSFSRFFSFLPSMIQGNTLHLQLNIPSFLWPLHPAKVSIDRVDDFLTNVRPSRVSLRRVLMYDRRLSSSMCSPIRTPWNRFQKINTVGTKLGSVTLSFRGQTTVLGVLCPRNTGFSFESKAVFSSSAVVSISSLGLQVCFLCLRRRSM